MVLLSLLLTVLKLLLVLLDMLVSSSKYEQLAGDEAVAMLLLLSGLCGEATLNLQDKFWVGPRA